jgi:hypothetical protein
MGDNSTPSALIIMAFIAILAFIVLFPFAPIWAINILFQTAIPFNFETWAASLVLLLAINGSFLSKS